MQLSHAADQYTTQQMCDKAILENGGTLKSVCYKPEQAIKLLIIILMH